MKDIILSWNLKKHWLPIGVIMTILIATAIYYGRGYWLVARAEKAYYDNADCQHVVEIVAKIKRQYPASIAPYISQSRTWADVCQSFLSAAEQREAGQYEAALKIYDIIKTALLSQNLVVKTCSSLVTIPCYAAS